VSKVQVQLTQFNHFISGIAYLPYSAGVLTTFAQKDADIATNVEFRLPLFRRERVSDIVAGFDKVDILGLSAYTWNWNLSVEVARQTRQVNPKALIVMGGPHVPDRMENFFEKYPFVDIAAHGEGELTFRDILRAHLGDRRYGEIGGLSFNDRATGTVVHNEKRERLTDLDMVPSPYLSGTFDELMRAHSDIRWQAIWETNRGCPFTCTFCDWGSAINTKLRKYEDDRLYRELEWFGRHKIDYLLGADANFGILERDRNLALHMAKVKEEYGFPQKFRVCFTKNTTQKIIDVAEILERSALARGTSISMQSLDENVLKNIKRQNIKLSTFKELQRQYIKRDIPTFSEFILGLPGESYQTFTRGITELIENGQHSKIEIYYCDVMPNAEMGDPAYQAKFGIRFVTIPLFQPHSSPVETEWDIVENQFIIHETSALPTADWKRAGRFAWAIQFLHMLKVGQYVALYFRNRHDVSFLEFYESFLEFASGRRDGFIREELDSVDRVHENVVQGLGFDQYVPEFSSITWPMEEASFLRLSLNRDRFYAEFREFVDFLADKLVLTVDAREIDDLLLYQQAAVVHFDDVGDKTLDLSFDFPEYLYGCTVAVKSTDLHAGRFRYLLRNTVNLQGNKKRFAEEILWGGRKGGRFMYVAEHVPTT